MSKKENVASTVQKDAMKSLYESYGEKWESTQELHKGGIVACIERRGAYSNLKVTDVWKVNDDHFVVKIYGGQNGRGDWSKYLEDIKSIIDFTPSYVIKLDVDVPDDVWTLYLGIHIVNGR